MLLSYIYIYNLVHSKHVVSLGSKSCEDWRSLSQEFEKKVIRETIWSCDKRNARENNAKLTKKVMQGNNNV
jgi:hypothetical protein